MSKCLYDSVSTKTSSPFSFPSSTPFSPDITYTRRWWDKTDTSRVYTRGPGRTPYYNFVG